VSTTTRARSVKANQSARFAELALKAEAAGTAAGTAVVPPAMIVGTPTSPFGSDIDYSKPTYYVSEGPCGFASIRFPGNTAFGRWAKSSGLATPAYNGGLRIFVGFGGQSLARKEAYANAYAAVLRDAGVDAYIESRMD